MTFNNGQNRGSYPIVKVLGDAKSEIPNINIHFDDSSLESIISSLDDEPTTDDYFFDHVSGNARGIRFEDTEGNNYCVSVESRMHFSLSANGVLTSSNQQTYYSARNEEAQIDFVFEDVGFCFYQLINLKTNKTFYGTGSPINKRSFMLVLSNQSHQQACWIYREFCNVNADPYEGPLLWDEDGIITDRDLEEKYQIEIRFGDQIMGELGEVN